MQVLGQHLVQRAHAGRRRRSPCRGCRASSSSSCTVPSSPSRPCRATNATSGAASRSRATRSPPDVDADDLVAEALERVLDARARAQRDLALERAAALEDRDAAHRAPAPALRGAAAAGRRPGSSAGGTRDGARGRRPAPAGQRAVQRRPARGRPRRCGARPRGCRPRRRRRSSAASTSRRGRRGRRARPGHERDVVAQRAGEQVGRVDEVGQRRPDEQAALRAASTPPRAGSARRARRA